LHNFCKTILQAAEIHYCYIILRYVFVLAYIAYICTDYNDCWSIPTHIVIFSELVDLRTAVLVIYIYILYIINNYIVYVNKYSLYTLRGRKSIFIIRGFQYNMYMCILIIYIKMSAAVPLECIVRVSAYLSRRERRLLTSVLSSSRGVFIYIL
jgi:hypothetical protein